MSLSLYGLRAARKTEEEGIIAVVLGVLAIIASYLRYLLLS